MNESVWSITSMVMSEKFRLDILLIITIMTEDTIISLLKKMKKDIEEIKKMVNYDYSKDIEEAVKEKESEMNDNFEKEKEEIMNDANEIIRILEEENIQVKESLKNKIISSLSE